LSGLPIPRSALRLWVRLRGVWDRTADRELSLIAAGVAFFGFMALFPALAAVIALWGFMADPTVIRAEVALLADVLPPDAFSLLSQQVEALLATNSRQIGWATLVPTVVALWSARAGVDALLRGLNAIHGLPPRGQVEHLAQALLLTLVLVALAMAAMALAVVVPLVLAALPIDRFEALWLELMNLALVLALVVVAVALIYRMGPNHDDHARVPVLSRGLLIALVLWAAASRGLVVYLANFGSYNKIYGSIGAVVALLLWFWLSAYAILLGAAVDAERSARRRA
jgi:membrane protein